MTEPNRQLRLWPTHSYDIGCAGWRLRLSLPGLSTQNRQRVRCAGTIFRKVRSHYRYFQHIRSGW